MSFKVGDVCVIVDADDFTDNRYLIGMECEIIALPGFRVMGQGRPIDSYLTMVSDGATAWFMDRHLRLKRPPANYDGNQAGDWELCPFQPYRQKERA
jgi:hypothetical protein